MRKYIAAILLATVGFITFKFFEPIFVYKLGWEQLPNNLDASAETNDPEWAATAEEANKWLANFKTKLNAPAMSAAVSVDGELVWASSVGYSDIEGRVEATPHTAFRIGSSSKAITSVAMGILLENNLVDLDTQISRYISDLNSPLRQITTRQIMSHTAGVRDYGVCLCFPIWEYYNRKHYDDQRDAMRPYETSKLLSLPGEKFQYTSFGYNITGAIIESVSEMSFEGFLKQRVFEPLKMNRTYTEKGDIEGDVSIFYEIDGSKYKRTFPVDNTNKLPSGGIIATPTDMTRLGQQMITPTLFGKNTRDRLIEHQMFADGQPVPQGYALGWRRHDISYLDESLKTPVYHHHGVAYGAVSHFSIYPEYGLVVSVMMNKNSQTFGDQIRPLVELFLLEINTRKHSVAEN